MENQPITETGLIARLARIVEEERKIIPNLPEMNFDESTLGLAVFSGDHVRAFQSIVHRHAQLLDNLQQKFSSQHLKPPTIEDIRDAVKVFLQDYGYTIGDPQPTDTVMRTLINFRKIYPHTIERLGEEASEESKEIRKDAPTAPSPHGFKSMGEYTEAMKRHSEEMDRYFEERERHDQLARGYEHAVTKFTKDTALEISLSRNFFANCLGAAINIKKDLVTLVGQRWLDSPQKTRE